jgi:2-iminoacetate synthase
MKFNPEKCKIEDKRMQPFIDPDELWHYINTVKPDKQRVREVIAKSLDKQRLNTRRNGCTDKYNRSGID